jgi:GWxTD domain-containing protein
MFVPRPFVCLVLLLTLTSLVPRAHAVTPKQLPPQFKQWLEEDVTYIISEEERKEFLRLRSDEEREKYIRSFWDSRNPDGNSTINTFKEEHYRRLAYVRANFGDSRYNDGWRTDMGRVYITLGPPKQRAPYHIGRNTREVEIWFYQSTSPALPPYFNVVFYKRGAGEPYILYSPREDGPKRIVTNDAHTDTEALHIIEQSMGEEAVHAMVTLFPDEPINRRDPAPNMNSDFLLAAIRNLPDQALEKERIHAIKSARQEKTLASIFTGANSSSLDTAVLRDDKGRETVHFLVRNQQIDPRLVGTLPDKRAGYSMTLTMRVMTADSKAIYQQSEVLQGTVSVAGAAAAKERLFAAEGRLPLVPGSYEIEATLTNNLTHEGTRATRKVTVPSVHPDSVGISDLVAYTSPSPVADPGGLAPFSVSKLRFTPRGPQAVQIHAGDKLPIMYQIWFPQSDLKGQAPTTPKLVHVHYLIGSVVNSVSRSPLEEDEDVEVKNLDAAGNLLTGRTVDTSHLEQGTYRLVAKVTEPGTPRSAFATMTIKVLPAEATIATWTAYGAESTHPEWQEDMERGVAAEALGNNKEAAACYRRALSANPAAVDAQTRLDALAKKEIAHNTAAK